MDLYMCNKDTIIDFNLSPFTKMTCNNTGGVATCGLVFYFY